MERKYDDIINKNIKEDNYISNVIRAFVVGGIISVIGQSLIFLYEDILNLTTDLSISLMVTTLILVSTILTAIGKYDIISQFSGAGTIVPITGFANTMTSSAMESRSEGVILGISTNMFKLAGSVITLGVVSAYVFGSIRYFLEVML